MNRPIIDVRNQTLQAKQIVCDNLQVGRSATATQAEFWSTQPTTALFTDLTTSEDTEHYLTESGTYVVDATTQTLRLPELTEEDVYDIRIQPDLFLTEPPRITLLYDWLEHDGYVYMAGDIPNLYDGTPCYGLVRMDVQTRTMDRNWIPVLDVNYLLRVRSIAVYNDQLIAGGQFYLPEGAGQRLASISLTTAEVSPILNCNDTVEDVLVVGDYLYVGGWFSTVDGTSRKGLAKINLTNNTLTDYDAQLVGDCVYRLATYHTRLVVYGSLVTIAGTATNFATLPLSPDNPTDMSGDVWQFPIRFRVDGFSFEMKVFGIYLYVLNNNLTVDDIPKCFIRFDVEALIDPLYDENWSPLGSYYSTVYDFTQDPDTQDLVTGFERTAVSTGPNLRRNLSLARFSIADGSLNLGTCVQRFPFTKKVLWTSAGLLTFTDPNAPNHGLAFLYDRVTVRSSHCQTIAPREYFLYQVHLAQDHCVYRFLGYHGSWHWGATSRVEPFTFH